MGEGGSPVKQDVKVSYFTAACPEKCWDCDGDSGCTACLELVSTSDCSVCGDSQYASGKDCLECPDGCSA